MKSTPPKKERRTQPRSSGDESATSIVQLLIQHPGRVAEVLEQDLAAGADPEALAGLLDAAEAILAIRGVNRRTHLAVLRKRFAARPPR